VGQAEYHAPWTAEQLKCMLCWSDRAKYCPSLMNSSSTSAADGWTLAAAELQQEEAVAESGARRWSVPRSAATPSAPATPEPSANPSSAPASPQPPTQPQQRRPPMLIHAASSNTTGSLMSPHIAAPVPHSVEETGSELVSPRRIRPHLRKASSVLQQSDVMGPITAVMPTPSVALADPAGAASRNFPFPSPLSPNSAEHTAARPNGSFARRLSIYNPANPSTGTPE
jgi:hypothetical protein